MHDIAQEFAIARGNPVTGHDLVGEDRQLFYEDRGLIASHRTGSGHRRYPRAVLRRIAFIVFAQKIGLSLDEIGAELSKLPANRVPEPSDWAKLSVSFIHEMSLNSVAQRQPGESDSPVETGLRQQEVRFVKPGSETLHGDVQIVFQGQRYRIFYA